MSICVGQRTDEALNMELGSEQVDALEKQVEFKYTVQKFGGQSFFSIS